MTRIQTAKFALGQIVRHRDQAFRGVVIDADAAYAASGARPDAAQRDQPFYRVLAMGEDAGFLVYAAEEVLERDPAAGSLSSADRARWFTVDDQGRYAPREQPIH